MKIVCSICGSTIYDSEDLTVQQSANMCSLCRRVVCDKCFYEKGQICIDCDKEFVQNCSFLDCIANLRGKCTADFCSGRFLPEDEDDKDMAEKLTAAQRREIYDILAEELFKEFGIEILNIDDITIIQHVNIDFLDPTDEEENNIDEEEFDDTVDYGDDIDNDSDYDEGFDF